MFYYVLSNGGHPFGDTVKRQLNILSYEYDLKIFDGEKYESSKVYVCVVGVSFPGVDRHSKITNFDRC